jgi:protein SCO1/2
MARHAVGRQRLLAAGLAGALFLTACRTGTQPPVLVDELPAFSLVDQSGAPFRNSDMDGHLWLVGFIYTSCPGTCPAVVRAMRKAAAELEDVAELRMLAVSVDPTTDTPEVLRRYADQHGLDSERAVLVTGTRAAVLDLVRRGFLLSTGPTSEIVGQDVSPEELARIIEKDGPITHSIRLAVVDPDGRVRGYFHSNDEESMLALAQTVRTLAH